MKRLLWTLLLGLGATFSVWYGFFHPETPLKPATLATAITPRPLSAFSLLDTNQQPFTEHSLLGHWTLLFFGYSQCPEICPKTLMTVHDVWEQFPVKPKNLEFVFVSLDNDEPGELKRFLNSFDTRFTGLTGNEAAVETLSHSCNIYRWEGIDPRTQSRIIDHSASLILINPNAEIQAFFSPPHQASAIVRDLYQFIP